MAHAGVTVRAALNLRHAGVVRRLSPGADCCGWLRGGRLSGAVALRARRREAADGSGAHLPDLDLLVRPAREQLAIGVEVHCSRQARRGRM